MGRPGLFPAERSAAGTLGSGALGLDYTQRLLTFYIVFEKGPPNPP